MPLEKQGQDHGHAQANRSGLVPSTTSFYTARLQKSCRNHVQLRHHSIFTRGVCSGSLCTPIPQWYSLYVAVHCLSHSKITPSLHSYINLLYIDCVAVHIYCSSHSKITLSLHSYCSCTSEINISWLPVCTLHLMFILAVISYTSHYVTSHARYRADDWSIITLNIISRCAIGYRT